MEYIDAFKRAGLQWLSANEQNLQIFWNQPQTACYNGWLRQVLLNRYSDLDIYITREKRMGGIDVVVQQTSFNIYMCEINELRYLLTTIPGQQKHKKIKRPRGCSFSFMMLKEPFIGWMAATRISN